AAFANRPDDERLAAAHVTGGENLGHRGSIVIGVRLDVRARVAVDAELLEHSWANGTDEAHRQEHEIRLELEFAAWNLDHFHRAAVILLPFDARGDQLLDPSVASFESLRRHGPVTLTTFFVRRRRAQFDRPVRPHERLVLL